MPDSALSGICFDEQDANLFLVDDIRLRADALKHSILPRLRILINVAIARIREIYGIDVLEDSTISVFPNFREKRYKHELSLHYEAAFAGLGGQRKAKWPGVARKDGKPVQILPFRFAFELSAEGLGIHLENGWLTGLDKSSFGAMLQFHLDNEAIINRLCFASRMYPFFYWADDLPFFAPFEEHYRHRVAHGVIDNHFWSYPYKFPVETNELVELVEHFILFFPVYDAYIQLAKGLSSRLLALLDSLNRLAEREYAGMELEEQRVTPETEEAVGEAARAAANKIPVMPAMRWQVFQRDKWKCVACGRGVHDGAILQVDHIIPRSRGGSDRLENFQTLCNRCNLGKGNRDMTDLRKRG